MGNRKELLNKEKSNKEMVVVVGMTVFFIAMLCVWVGCLICNKVE
jgi:hypothetical protein